MKITLWGTRGSVPSPPSAYRRYSSWGGNTPCLCVETDDGEAIVLDAGTGLHWLGHRMLKADFSRGAGEAHILLTHLHWGHIQGIPFFPPMLIPGNRFTFYGPASSRSLDELLSFQMDPVYCPVPNAFEKDVGAQVETRALGDNTFQIGRTRILARRINHTSDSICLGYRLECGSASLAYLPDVEYLDPSHRTPALELASKADLLVHDAHYTASEYERHRGKGHCCDRDAVELAQEAGARRLLLFHHHPACSDDPDRYAAALDDPPVSSLSVEPAREGNTYELSEILYEEAKP